MNSGRSGDASSHHGALVAQLKVCFNQLGEQSLFFFENAV